MCCCLQLLFMCFIIHYLLKCIVLFVAVFLFRNVIVSSAQNCCSLFGNVCCDLWAALFVEMLFLVLLLCFLFWCYVLWIVAGSLVLLFYIVLQDHNWKIFCPKLLCSIRKTNSQIYITLLLWALGGYIGSCISSPIFERVKIIYSNLKLMTVYYFHLEKKIN